MKMKRMKNPTDSWKVPIDVPRLQNQFIDAVKNNNKQAIENIIHEAEEKNLLNLEYEEYEGKNIFLIACDDRYGMEKVNAETLQFLMDRMDFKQPSKEDFWECIHYTALNANSDKMEAIIAKLSSEEVNSLVCCLETTLQKYHFCPKNEKDTFSNNALHILLKYGRKTKDFKKCFKILIEAGVSCDHQNSEELSPNDLIKDDKELKKIVLEQLRKTSVYKGVKFERLNSITNLKNHLLIKSPEEANLTDGGEERFSSCTLLQLFCVKGLVDCVDYLLEKQADPNKVIPKNTIPPIIIAMKQDYECIVNLLLKKEVHLDDEILIQVQSISKDDALNDKYMNIILEYLQNKEPEIVEKYIRQTDKCKRTPLHHATHSRHPDIILKLLEMGASLMDEDDNGTTPLHIIDNNVLERHFDSCINGTKNCEPILKITYNSLMINTDSSNFQESKFLSDMIKTVKLNPLIIHPLVLTFLAVKWQRYKWVLYVDLGVYILAFFALIGFGGAFVSNIEVKSFILIPFVILILRTLIQLVVLNKTYLQNFSNVIDFFLIGGILYIIVANWNEYFNNRNVYVAYSVVVLTSTLGTFFNMRRFSFFTIKVLTFQKISVSFFKYAVFYIFPVLAFALSFYILIDDKSGNFFKMSYQTITMFAGDVSSDFPEKFGRNPIFSHSIYIIFIVFICIILHNLLLGLAVNDLQEIQKQAEFIDKKERSKYVTEIENLLSKFEYSRKLSSSLNLFHFDRDAKKLSKSLEKKTKMHFELKIWVDTTHPNMKKDSTDQNKDEDYKDEDYKEEDTEQCYKVFSHNFFTFNFHMKTVFDNQLHDTLEATYKNFWLKNKKLEDPYTNKNLHEKIARLETLILNGLKRNKKDNNRATIL